MKSVIITVPPAHPPMLYYTYMSVFDTYVLIQALTAHIMGNKTISIDEICEGILIKMREEDPFFSFSLWIRAKMLEEYNKGKVNLEIFERLVPSHYHCQTCKATGSHWTKDCPHLGGLQNNDGPELDLQGTD